MTSGTFRDDVRVASGGHVIDRTTQTWVRATGRRVRLDDHPWLIGPVGDPLIIGDQWVVAEAGRLNGTLSEGGGLLGNVDCVAGGNFDPGQLAAPVIDFYE